MASDSAADWVSELIGCKCILIYIYIYIHVSYVKISFDGICRLGSPKCYLARSLMDLPLRRSTNPMLMTKPRMVNTYIQFCESIWFRH